MQVATIGPKNTIAFAIGVNFVFFVIYALDLVTTMERVYAMVAFGTLGYVAYPTITSAQQRRPPPPLPLWPPSLLLWSTWAHLPAVS